VTASPAGSLTSAAVRDVAALLPDWLETQRHLRRQSGVQVALWHAGELVAETAVGWADEPAAVLLRTDHSLRIASHSKMFTALAILRLQEQGRLRLDDTVGERVPALAGSPVADRTLRDLLSHSAGLTRDSDDARWWRLGIPFADRETLLGIARAGAVRTEPGLHLQYSNIGYGLLGLVIEEVTGQPYERAVAELVIDPVGVTGLGPDLPADAPGPEARGGFALGHTSLLHGPRRTVEQVPTGALAAATGFWASAGAIARFAGEVLTRGALLAPRSLREMRRRVWTLDDGGQYGLGLQEGRLHGFTAIGHSGGFPTGLSRTWAVPTEQLVVSVIGTSVDFPSAELAHGILGLLSMAAGRPAPSAERWERAGAQGGGSDGRERPAVLSEQEGVVLLGAGGASVSVEPNGTAVPGGGGVQLSAMGVAGLVAGSYDSLWGRTRLVQLGGRLFALDETLADPAASALELHVSGVRPDPIAPELTAVELATWGDTGYGSWAEPILARVELGGEPAGESAVDPAVAPTGAERPEDPASASSAPADGPEDPTSAPPTPGTAPRCVGLVVTGQLRTPTAEFTMPERVLAP
jgi:CubicO group peptidase (beta-lactamase class C family)